MMVNPAKQRAASRERTLSRLESRLDLLVAGDRDLPERQRTMRATLSWSVRT